LRRDADLALGIQRGNQNDLIALVERHHSPLLGFLYRMTGGDRALAEDMAQEAFLRVLRSIRHYQYPRPFKPWLYQIAVNLARDHFKRADTRYPKIDSDDVQLEGEWSDNPESVFLVDAQAQQIVMALRCLPPHQREAIVLRYYQELSLAEIAAALDIPVGTVKSRLSLGLSRLREMLLEQEV
jgi:RNA polymerase sigma-70 factor (ECF subfamily)